MAKHTHAAPENQREARSVEQFLTAVFELRPTRRKAATLEWVRALAEDVFWSVMADVQPTAEAVVQLDQKERRAAVGRLGLTAIAAASKAGLCEPVAQGLARDLVSSVGACVETRAKGREASWPVREEPKILPPLSDRLDTMGAALTLEDEAAARDALNARECQPKARPIILARERDCRIIRDDAGRIAVALNIIRASDERARPSTVHTGWDASSGELFNGSIRKTVVLVPIACSRWHENKFLSGKATLRSAIVYPRNGRWWLQAQFVVPVVQVEPSGHVLGIDRGVVHPVALALVDADGAVVAVPGRRGEDISRAVSDRREMMRQSQRGGSERFRRRLGRAQGSTRSAGEGKARTKMGRRIDHDLHVLANEIVETARQHSARVATERLDGLKQAIGTKRTKGARKGGWGTVLRKAQFAKLETLLGYKLAMAGLPKAREVLAPGTSKTCPACGHVDAKSRPDQATFKCVGCGFEHNADENAAIIIARRGVMEIKKGDKLDALHMNMVEGLRFRDDGGLGPLASSRRVVAVHATAARPNEPSGLNLAVGQNATQNATENPSGYSQSAVVANQKGPLRRLRKTSDVRPKPEQKQMVLL